MATSPAKFAQLLTAAVYKIRIAESKTIKKTLGMVQDELGYALGRAGGSCIEYWRKGYIPAKLEEVEHLARILVRGGGLDRVELVQFLASAGHPQPAVLAAELFPSPQDDAPAVELAPFFVGPPISRLRQFFGRTQELTRIFGLWRRFPLQNVAVIGRPRAGKTSLLRYLAGITTADPAQLRPGQRTDWLPQPQRYRWVFVDFQDARLGNQDRLLRHLLAGLDLPGPDPCTLNTFMDIVSQHLDRPAIILLDEIGAGLASPELDQQFWWSLRSLGSNYTDGRLGFLLTAPEAPALLAHEHGKPSPFFNIFGHTLRLGPLSEPEARELIASSPRPFAPAEIDWILNSSGCWPALLQILADTHLTALEEGQTGSAWRAEGLRRLEPFKYLLD
ncbi:MAG: ATP-binding protein [Chloroflexota bacterium]